MASYLFHRIAYNVLRIKSTTNSPKTAAATAFYVTPTTNRKSINTTYAVASYSAAAALAVRLSSFSEPMTALNKQQQQQEQRRIYARTDVFKLKLPQLPVQQQRHYSSQQSQKQQHNSTMVSQKQNRRNIISRDITKSMTFFALKGTKIDVDPITLSFKTPTGKPLVLMMAWLMAKQKHLKKYADIYVDLGFDVLVVHVTPWQLLWPVKGTQVVASETLKFLENNPSIAPLLLHGFSVGAYQFGEMMLQMSRDMERYNNILDRFVCQVWDSAADITEIPEGLPKSIFPKNARMQSALRNYTLYHMKTFHNQATIHYMRSSQMFHSTLLKSPALFLVGENDVIGPPSSNNAVRENWERANIKCTFKTWERSQHAAHMILHREDYLATLFKHLEECGLMGASSVKTRAKL